MKIKVAINLNHQLQQYFTKASAGCNLRANLDSDVLLMQTAESLIHAGSFLKIPIVSEGQTRPGSSQSVKRVVEILNPMGTIEADYADNVCNFRMNLSEENSVIRERKRIFLR
jgi:dUTP pyrophosphatase